MSIPSGGMTLCSGYLYLSTRLICLGFWNEIQFRDAQISPR